MDQTRRGLDLRMRRKKGRKEEQMGEGTNERRNRQEVKERDEEEVESRPDKRWAKSLKMRRKRGTAGGTNGQKECRNEVQ